MESGSPACATPTQGPCQRLKGLCRDIPLRCLAMPGQCQLLGAVGGVTHLPWKCPFFPWAVASLPTSQERACWDSAPGEERADPRGNPRSWDPSCPLCPRAGGTRLCCWCMGKLSHRRARAHGRGSAVVVVLPCPGTGCISGRGSTESDGARRGLRFGLLWVWMRCQQVLTVRPVLPRCCGMSCGTCTAC